MLYVKKLKYKTVEDHIEVSWSDFDKHNNLIRDGYRWCAKHRHEGKSQDCYFKKEEILK